MGRWHSYRASKAALNRVISNVAIDLARRNPKALCVGLHPGTVGSDLPQTFRGNAPMENLFTPHFVAVQLLSVLYGLTIDDSGNLLAWDGLTIPH